MAKNIAFVYSDKFWIKSLITCMSLMVYLHLKSCIGIKYKCHFLYVTGSEKTQHNHASLNLQYTALNTMGEVHVLFFLNWNFFEHFVLSEEKG